MDIKSEKLWRHFTAALMGASAGIPPSEAAYRITSMLFESHSAALVMEVLVAGWTGIWVYRASSSGLSVLRNRSRSNEREWPPRYHMPKNINVPRND